MLSRFPRESTDEDGIGCLIALVERRLSEVTCRRSGRDNRVSRVVLRWMTKFQEVHRSGDIFLSFCSSWMFDNV